MIDRAKRLGIFARGARDTLNDMAQYGGHCVDLSDALTLFEVGGASQFLVIRLGCEVFSQFPPTYRAGRAGQTIDYVWAIRGEHDRSPQRRWHVVAAFECEGLNVPDDSLAQDVDKLSAVTQGERIPTAVVLYRTCEDGSVFWRPGKDSQAKQREWFESGNRRLRTLCEQRSCAVIPAVMDFELLGDCSSTVQALMH